MQNIYTVFLGLLCILIIVSSSQCAVTTDGLILHLDAESQIKEGGKSASNTTWRNLAQQSDSIAGAAILHNLKEDGTSGWVGSGSVDDPYALQFDSENTYGTGSGNLEIPEITIEAWARVDGYKLRGATLIGNDFGKGGISIEVLPTSNSLVFLHDLKFSQIGADVTAGEWHQIVVAWKAGIARFYVDGLFAMSAIAERALQSDHYPGYNIGAGRFPEHDYAAADALKGAIGIIRVYNRTLSKAEIECNFNTDVKRFPVNNNQNAYTPVSSMPVPSIPGIASAPFRCMKWDYYYSPVGVTSSALNAVAAFNGYPANLSQSIENSLCTGSLPTPDKPTDFIINYKRPVAVTRFAHYYDRFRGRNAWKDVVIYSSSDNENWTLCQQFNGLQSDPIQYLSIDKPAPARFYKISVKSLSDGSTGINTQEIESYYGTTIGSISINDVKQSEKCRISIKVVNPDADVNNAVIKLTAPPNTLTGLTTINLPKITKGESAVITMDVTPMRPGQIPVMLEMRSGEFLIDKRSCTVVVEPKLTINVKSLSGAIIAAPGQAIEVTGDIINAGSTPAAGVRVAWLGKSVFLGDIDPGRSKPFLLAAKVRAGYKSGDIVASGSQGEQTTIRRSVICKSKDQFTVKAGTLSTDWRVSGNKIKFSASSGSMKMVTGSLEIISGKDTISLIPVASDGNSGTLAARISRAVIIVKVTGSKAGDPTLQCSVLSDDPYPTDNPWLDFEMRLAVDDPKIMFRPHIDWYTVEHGPNFPAPTNGHNSTTRMLAIQTPNATMSMVPDTDNIMWGFTPQNSMSIAFQVPLTPYDQLNQGIWRSIYQSPDRFTLTLPIRKGDWWDSYRYVVTELFGFEQPRQWAMPITQMQMLTVRELMSYQAWSEKWQNVKVYSSDGIFWPFYATSYTLPAIYSWYLATDNMTAKVKSEKIIDWLLSVQHIDPPMQGAWFTAYWSEGTPAKMVGTDFIHNRWLIPHGTGNAVKTLLWYWNASGRKDTRVLSAARSGCEWLLRTMNPDGGWPYAFDLDGSRITDQCGAGQIWCTWALWDMYQYTGDTRYRDAALKSKDFFKKTYMDVHRYVGYWEDTVGVVKGQNSKISSWEGYEPAIACLVFSEMGEKDLAIEAAKDTAVWSWTRVISTRQYETCYGQTTEQALCGPSQAQSPMVGVAMHEIFKITGDKLWRDYSGAVKAVNFAADPDQEYGMVATSGWNQPLTGVAGPPYDDVRPFVTPNMSKGDYGRQLWTGWCTDQFAWLALEWLIREGNIRAPHYVNIDPRTLRGTVLGAAGRIKMPEEKCDINGIDHYDINWVGYQNDQKYALLIMNHKEKLIVAVKPHEAHLDIYNRPPQILIGDGNVYREAPVVKQGIQYMVTIPKECTALMVWDRIK
ncbi:MAG: LamG-like jellyroll fold domain-containing protein [Armatimonadota bacterium]